MEEGGDAKHVYFSLFGPNSFRNKINVPSQKHHVSLNRHPKQYCAFTNHRKSIRLDTKKSLD